MRWMKRTERQDEPASYLDALKAEVRILIRAIVDDSTKNISDLKIQWKDNDKPVTLEYPDVVLLIAKPNPSDLEQTSARTGQLQAVRDGLGRMARPATGYSIAYTSLIVGNERGTATEATYQLAQQAYGGLTRKAILHRWSIRFLAVCVLVIALFASWEATKASLGRSLLQTLEPLRAQQTKLADEKKQLETDTGPRSDTGDYAIHPICERYQSVLLATAPNDKIPTSELSGKDAARIRDVCGRDRVLGLNFQMAHDGLALYLANWPEMVGGLYAPMSHWIDAIGSRVDNWTGGTAATPAHASSVIGDDVEFRVAPVIQVITAYILPFVFGIIGSLLYVLLQHYTSVRANLLEPRDHVLAYIRIVLGIVVAASVSLLITSNSGPSEPLVPPASGSTSPNSLVGSLTFSASLITFLAGFGAEAVFTLLQNLVDRVFAIEKA
jgi:hypothetical protein